MTTNPYTLCPHCGETHHEDETHGCAVHIIHVLDDGETWSGDCYEIELTKEQYDRICEGEKPCNVVPEQFED